jgi:hypothetical protein
MPNLSLKERINLLEGDLLDNPPSIKLHNDMPFAILRYDCEDEWTIRKEARLLAVRLRNHGKEVYFISIAELLWQAISESEGLDAIVELEKERGFETAQEQVAQYLTDPDWSPLHELLIRRFSNLDPTKDIVFLTRASSMAPKLYQLSKLFEELQGYTSITAVLFYPGNQVGTHGLNFMGLKKEADIPGNYRVKIYG